ncbi:MAG: hypothetical protein ACRCXZ_02705 [Patescibacteria group bacterium]
MCIFVKQAVATGTKELIHQINDEEQLLMYQNTVSSLEGPNCMVLPMVNAESLSGNQIFLAPYESVLDDILSSALSGPPTRSGSSRSLSAKSIEIIERGIYTIIVYNDASLVKDALLDVPTNKRPEFNQGTLNLLNNLDSSGILACFDNAESKKAAPICIRYKTKDPSIMVAPGWDDHDGTGDVSKNVKRDHTIVFTAQDYSTWSTWDVNYSQSLNSEWKTMLPKLVGFPIVLNGKSTPNGDIKVTLEDVQNQSYRDNYTFTTV